MIRRRRFEAVVVDGKALARGSRPDRERLKHALRDAVRFGLHIRIVRGRRPSGPAWPQIPADAAGSLIACEAGSSAERTARHCLAELWLRGVAPSQVLLALDEGPKAVLDLLDDQSARRRRRELPEPASQPGWALQLEGVDPQLGRVQQSLLALSDGVIGTRVSPLGGSGGDDPAVLVAGVYHGEGERSELLHGPRWDRLPIEADERADLRRTLDLHSGLLHQHLVSEAEDASALMFSSLARPGTVALRLLATDGHRHRLSTEEGPLAVASPDTGKTDGAHWARVAADPGGIAAAARETETGEPGAMGLDRYGVYVSSAARVPEAEEVIDRLSEVEGAGFEGLLDEHRAAWARRWETADVRIEGDPRLQLAVRFALFHLIGSVRSGGEAAAGARGLSGSAYRGHVFWDACVYVLPFLAATHPPAARAMLEYRVRRLGAALEAARECGRRGAKFPWESAADGTDVTPGLAWTRAGEEVVIRTGELEEHIVADVAWGVAFYLDWTGDEDFRRRSGARLLVETARYWASRVEIDSDGRGHITGVIGPDEYHVDVDDNAFTNVMARWNLRRAANEQGGGATREERRRWPKIADALVDGYVESTRVYEQFAGFFDLEPLVISEVAPARPIAADLLLGRERVAGAQVLKQADALMIHHLVPAEAAPKSLEANLDFYEPRTAHASSLSPGVHASLLARSGRLAAACDALSLASRIDLDDLSATTAGGLHLAAMGSVWQALAFGFSGLGAQGRVLAVDPRIPDSWKRFEIRLRFRGVPVRIRLDDGEGEIASEGPVAIRLPGREPILTGGTGRYERFGAIGAKA